MAEGSVREIILKFRDARQSIEETFEIYGAVNIVRMVLKGAIPRKGICADGLEYFVHGVGYTVVFEDGGQAHIDGANEGDAVKSYDLQFFMESSASEWSMDIKDIEAECDALAREGVLCKLSSSIYVIPRSK